MLFRVRSDLVGKYGLYALVAASFLLLGTVAVTYVEINDRVRAASESIREDALWASMQLDREAMKLQVAILSLSPAPSEAELAEVSQRYDILYSRTELLAQGNYDSHFRTDPTLRVLSVTARNRILDLEPLLDRLRPGVAQPSLIAEIGTSLTALKDSTETFLVRANARKAELQVRGREEVRRSSLVLGGAVASLTLTLGAVIVLLGLQLRQIRHSQARLRELNADFARAAASAEAGNRAKTAFLAAMSHEIRTPLNAVLGTVDLMSEEQLSEGQRQKLSTISECSQALLGIINDVLDFSKLESGSIDLEIRSFSLPGALDGALQIVRTQAVEKGLVLTCDVPPVSATGDETRLRQILVNFLSNAVKFTPGGSVSLRAETETRPGWIRFEVTDTGVGITADALARLFREFSQVDASISRRFGGTGLGLAIAQRLTRAMGGEIGVRSAQGRGSTFWCTLPLGPILPLAAPEPASAPAAQAPQHWTGHVLLVEDNLLSLRVASELLQRLGVTVETAVDGLAAVERIRANSYDLVLMDMQMPVMDGLEATRAIRAEGHVGLPIVGLTANAFVSDRDACLEAGMNDFVAKPVNRAKLAALFERWLRPGQPHALPAGPAAPAVQGERVSDVDDEQQKGLLQELGPDMFEVLVANFWSDARRLSSRAEAAQEEGDRESARRSLHALKGVAQTFGFLGIAVRARAAEEDLAATGRFDIAQVTAYLAQQPGRVEESVQDATGELEPSRA